MEFVPENTSGTKTCPRWYSCGLNGRILSSQNILTTEHLPESKHLLSFHKEFLKNVKCSKNANMGHSEMLRETSKTLWRVSALGRGQTPRYWGCSWCLVRRWRLPWGARNSLLRRAESSSCVPLETQAPGREESGPGKSHTGNLGAQCLGNLI